MAKANVASHSLRLNLDNEQHMRVERVLSKLNLSVHKSLNQFLVDAVDAYIRKLEGTEPVYEEKTKRKEKSYVTAEDLDRLRDEIRDGLQKEIIQILGSALAAGKAVQVLPVKEENEPKEQSKMTEDDTDEMLAGLADSWG